METHNYINGERLQNIAEIYLGTVDDFVENPRILEQIERHIVLCDVGPMFNNPRFVFLYPHRLQLFATKFKHFMNPFVLISHNSDVNLTENNEYVKQIMADEKLICWWGQNLCFINPKMRFLPIGLANTMCIQENIIEQPCEKSRGLYLNFRIYTNVDKRRQCADALNSRADGGMLPMVNAQEYKDIVDACMDPDNIWDNGNFYPSGSIVLAGDQHYVAIKNVNPGIDITNTEYWSTKSCTTIEDQMSTRPKDLEINDAILIQAEAFYQL